MTSLRLVDLFAADLPGLDLVAFTVDGIRAAEHACVVALSVTIGRTKVPLGLVEGATENATVVRDPRAGLRERGLDTLADPLRARLRQGAAACHLAGGDDLPCAAVVHVGGGQQADAGVVVGVVVLMRVILSSALLVEALEEPVEDALPANLYCSVLCVRTREASRDEPRYLFRACSGRCRWVSGVAGAPSGGAGNKRGSRPRRLH